MIIPNNTARRQRQKASSARRVLTDMKARIAVMPAEDVQAQMRAEWDQRAQDDAHYYVAFGRRDQDEEGFFATAVDVVRGLETELKRLPPGPLQARRALEIGCGPGRLMKPMSRHFGEIHGIDVSAGMIERAVRNLRDVPHAFPRAASGSDLAHFADASFDFVYSYAVFQHIPSRAVVLSYLREVVRVLRPGGIARLQINGLPEREGDYTTWDGVRFTGAAIREFTREHGLQLLGLDGERTQYMWTTWRKPAGRPRIEAVLNAHTGDRVVPARGSLACCSVWVEHLPADADLNTLCARIDGQTVAGSYIGPPDNGLTQVNFFLPAAVRTGLVPLELLWRGEPLCPPAMLRVIPPGPSVPRVMGLTDGTNLLSERRIESGVVKLFVEQIEHPEALAIAVDERPVDGVGMVCTDPLNGVYDCSFRLPAGTAKGLHRVTVSAGARRLPAVEIEVL